MRRSRLLLQLVGGAILLGLGGCASDPVAPADVAGSPTSGLYNDKGAALFLPYPPGLGCAVVDGVGKLVAPLDCRMEVSTPSTSFEATVVVRASGVANPTGEAVHWGPMNPGWQWALFFSIRLQWPGAPYPCGVMLRDGRLGLTFDWKAVVTPSGQAILSCHYSDKDGIALPLP